MNLELSKLQTVGGETEFVEPKSRIRKTVTVRKQVTIRAIPSAMGSFF